MPGKRVLSVGQCGADHGSISRTLERNFSADVVPADSSEEALALLTAGEFDLVLANRVFDADGGSGLELIRRLKQDERLRRIPVMLVSNYEDAQTEAIAAGAVLGFGKAALGHPQMLARLKTYLKDQP